MTTPAAIDGEQEERRSSRQRPPLVPADLDERIAKVKDSVNKLHSDAKKMVQRLLDSVADKSAGDYETNKRQYDQITSFVGEDSGLVLLFGEQRVTLLLTKPPPKTQAGYFEVRHSTDKTDLYHKNAWPKLTVVTAAEWAKLQKPSTSLEEKLA
jgi:hypothetical protein